MKKITWQQNVNQIVIFLLVLKHYIIFVIYFYLTSEVIHPHKTPMKHTDLQFRSPKNFILIAVIFFYVKFIPSYIFTKKMYKMSDVPCGKIFFLLCRGLLKSGRYLMWLKHLTDIIFRWYAQQVWRQLHTYTHSCIGRLNVRHTCITGKLIKPLTKTSKQALQGQRKM